MTLALATAVVDEELPSGAVYIRGCVVIPSVYKEMHFQATQGWGKKRPFDGGGRMRVWPGTLSSDGDCSELTVVFVAQSVFYNGIFLSRSLISMSLLHSVSFVHTNLTSSQVFFIFGAHHFHMRAFLHHF